MLILELEGNEYACTDRLPRGEDYVITIIGSTPNALIYLDKDSKALIRSACMSHKFKSLYVVTATNNPSFLNKLPNF